MLIGTSRLRIKAQTPAPRSNLVLLKSATSRQVAGRSQPDENNDADCAGPGRSHGLMTHTFPNSAIICLYRLGILAGVTLGDLDAVGPAQLH
jgi:hypothetical protein